MTNPLQEREQKKRILKGEAKFLSKGKKLKDMSRKELYKVIYQVDRYYQKMFNSRVSSTTNDTVFTYKPNQ